MVKWKCRF